MERSRVLHLGERPQWKKLLFYSKKWFIGERSLVPSGEFFLSPRGFEDPQAELEATLIALTSPNDSLQLNIDPPVSNHAQCRFPARFQWLSEQLDLSTVKQMPCVRYNQLREDIDPERISLIFSSGYMGNPASMFGHTLFRFHRRSGGSALLDHAVGFAATPNTKNPLVYAWRGAMGGFPGMFDVLPYYQKIQEYNNAESRDLWEYELNLSPSQVRLMLASVWEVGRFPIPYYYLDVNCASILFVLLDQTDPSFHFAEDIAMWVTPADVARSIADAPNLVRRTHYRPSSLTRYLGRLDTLRSDEERDALGNLLNSDEFLFRQLSSEARARVIDTALEFFDYTEKLSKSEAPKRYASLRSDLLRERAQIDHLPLRLPDPDEARNPTVSHGSVRLSAGFQHDRYGTGLGLNWRPALHDTLGNSAGFTGDLEIRFMDVHLRALPAGVALSELRLLDIVSLNPIRPNLTPYSWRLGLLMEEDEAGEENSDRSMRKVIRYALGLAFRPAASLLIYAMPLVDLAHSNARDQGLHAALGAQTGVLWKATSDFRLFMGWVGERRLGRVSLDESQLSFAASSSLFRDSEVRLESFYGLSGYRFLLSYAHYFWHFG